MQVSNCSSDRGTGLLLARPCPASLSFAHEASISATYRLQIPSDILDTVLGRGLSRTIGALIRPVNSLAVRVS